MRSEVAATSVEREPALHVVATAGHVDHGKSSLIVRLTGIDPDRWEEEKRRGLTIDLGFAWFTLPSGREIGFVDVPGHERFVRNMLAGVGPVRLVLFAVAADEGWKPQSEEHLAIVDVLGADGGVVALTKRDLVDDPALSLAEEEVRDRLAGTALEGVPIVPCSAETGEGIDELIAALDRVVAEAPDPETSGRPRHFVDRVFSIRGSGTVVTGTLTGGRLAVGQEVELYPAGIRARVRGLQRHKRATSQARPVSRIAANLVGANRERIARGDVVGLPGEWRPTHLFEARIRPVRGLAHPVRARGAYKLHAGSAERNARIHLFGREEVAEGESALARIRLSGPVVLDAFDRFVLREVGRRQTVAGGIVLDPDPPFRPGSDPQARLTRRERASRGELPSVLIAERNAIPISDVEVVTGLHPSTVDGATRTGMWWIANDVLNAITESLETNLAAFHAGNPLLLGTSLASARETVTAELGRSGAPPASSLADAVLERLAEEGRIVREASTVRLASHVVNVEGRAEVELLVDRIARNEPTPPTIDELVADGFAREVIEAATRAGLLVRVSPDLVMTPGFVSRAEDVIRRYGSAGITVSAFREQLGTSRKFALPLLEHFDQRKITVRRGDLRFPRAPASSG